MSASSSAPVESITRGLPMSKAGIRAGREPLARMQWSNVRVWLAPPAVAAAISRVLGLVNRALPRTMVTLRRRANWPRPPVSVEMTLSLRARSASTFTVGRGKWTPHSSISRVSASTRPTCRRALDGMQPRSRQVPPSRSSRSTRVTAMPRSAARKAAA